MLDFAYAAEAGHFAELHAAGIERNERSQNEACARQLERTVEGAWSTAPLRAVGTTHNAIHLLRERGHQAALSYVESVQRAMRGCRIEPRAHHVIDALVTFVRARG